jgi:hypothetical protein
MGEDFKGNLYDIQTGDRISNGEVEDGLEFDEDEGDQETIGQMAAVLGRDMLESWRNEDDLNPEERNRFRNGKRLIKAAGATFGGFLLLGAADKLGLTPDQLKEAVQYAEIGAFVLTLAFGMSGVNTIQNMEDERRIRGIRENGYEIIK